MRKTILGLFSLLPAILAGEIGLPANCERYTSCNGEMCAEICVEGTVELDAWASQALTFQRGLQFNRSLIYYEMPGTHNGAIAQDYEMGIEEDFLDELLEPVYPRNHDVVIANQRHGIFDQLRMGVRHIEVDIYLYDYLGGIKVCHWPVCPPDFYVIVENAAKQQGLDPLDWDCGNLGCDQRKPYYEKILVDIREWLLLPENKNEFVMIYIDNKNLRVRDIPEFVNLTESILGEFLFRPTHKSSEYPNRWPRVSELVEKNRRVLIENNNNDWAGNEEADQTVFTPPIWVQFGAGSFSSYPECTVGGRDYYGSQFTRSLDGSLVLGPAFLWDGRSDYPLETIIDMAKCGINIQSLDQIGYEKMQYFVWSWARDEPKISNACTLMNSNGRWEAQSCAQSHYFACVSQADELKWTLSSTQGSWSSDPACPSGYTFSLPPTGYLNSKLAEVAQGKTVWLNHRT